MEKVILDISMSVDGFIAGPNDNRKQPLGEGGEQLHDWIWRDRSMTGNEDLMQGGTTATTGATVVGRRTYDLVVEGRNVVGLLIGVVVHRSRGLEDDPADASVLGSPEEHRHEAGHRSQQEHRRDIFECGWLSSTALLVSIRSALQAL
jgi:dihydrofolate reductase